MGWRDTLKNYQTSSKENHSVQIKLNLPEISIYASLCFIFYLFREYICAKGYINFKRVNTPLAVVV